MWPSRSTSNPRIVVALPASEHLQSKDCLRSSRRGALQIIGLSSQEPPRSTSIPRIVMTVIASEHINEPEIGPSKIGPSIKNTHVGFSGRVIC